MCNSLSSVSSSLETPSLSETSMTFAKSFVSETAPTLPTYVCLGDCPALLHFYISSDESTACECVMNRVWWLNFSLLHHWMPLSYVHIWMWRTRRTNEKQWWWMETMNWLHSADIRFALHHWPTSQSEIWYLRNIEENNFRQEIYDFFISITSFGTVTIRQTRLDSVVTSIQNSARTKNSFYFTFYFHEVLTVWKKYLLRNIFIWHPLNPRLCVSFHTHSLHPKDHTFYRKLVKSHCLFLAELFSLYICEELNKFRERDTVTQVIPW